MTTPPPTTPLWVCMIVPLLRKAAKEIRKLREEGEQPGLFALATKENDDA